MEKHVNRWSVTIDRITVHQLCTPVSDLGRKLQMCMPGSDPHLPRSQFFPALRFTDLQDASLVQPTGK